MVEEVQRNTGLGGTDVAAIVGLSPYKKPWDVYADKRGLSEPFEQTERMRIGIAQQPTIVSLFEARTGRKVTWFDKTIRHPKVSFIIGTPDGLLEEDAGFEAKTAGIDQAWRWGVEQDDLPEEYLIQCQWYMLLTGRPRWSVAALIGGDRFVVHELAEDKDFQSMLYERAERFWVQHIEKGIQPEFDGAESIKSYLLRMFPRADGKIVRDATPVEYEAMREYLSLNRELKQLETAKEVCGQRLKAAIADKYGIEAEGLRAIWYETQESSYMVTRPAGRTLKVTDKRRGDVN